MSEWFVEKLNMAQHLKTQILVEKKIHSEKTQYQEIGIFDTVGFGRMLTLDEVIMCTEKDEHSYHEMIAHVPMFSHKNPKNVLVVGGGDGGTVRELVRHNILDKVDLCEIDEKVIEASKKFLPTMSNQFSNPKVNIVIEDGFKWVKNHKNHYDVIIVDSSDPVGPAEILFKEEFIKYCYESLKEDGILVNQAEHLILFTDIIKEILSFGKKYFPIYLYYNTLVPTYPGGCIGFTFFSKKYTPFENTTQRWNSENFENWNLKYYTKQIHKASFVLPKEIIQELELPEVSLQ